MVEWQLFHCFLQRWFIVFLTGHEYLVPFIVVLVWRSAFIYINTVEHQQQVTSTKLWTTWEARQRWTFHAIKRNIPLDGWAPVQRAYDLDKVSICGRNLKHKVLNYVNTSCICTVTHTRQNHQLFNYPTNFYLATCGSYVGCQLLYLG